MYISVCILNVYERNVSALTFMSIMILFNRIVNWSKCALRNRRVENVMHRPFRNRDVIWQCYPRTTDESQTHVHKASVHYSKTFSTSSSFFLLSLNILFKSPLGPFLLFFDCVTSG